MTASPTKSERAAQVSDLIANLGDTAESLLSLKRALDDEREALADRDAERLDLAVSTKASRVHDVAGFERFRITLCKQLGVSTDSRGMDDLLAECGAESELAGVWRQVLALSADCDRINLANGAIIRIRQQQTSDGLLLMRGTAPTISTYGPTGTASAAHGGRALTEA